MKNKNFWENFILVAIILVIIQTFLDDYSNLKHWPVFVRNILLIFSLLFDIIFTVEFIVRSILANKKKKLLTYWMYQRGWVDFLSSVPLLFLNSGPSFWLLITGKMSAGAATIRVLNVLKVVKAIRVTRILRLIRVMKIFGKIHNAKSAMAQHHTAVISTISVFTVITVLLFFSFFTSSNLDNSIYNRKVYYANLLESVNNMNENLEVPFNAMIREIFANDNKILKIYYGKNDLIFSRISDVEFRKYYNIDDYIAVKNNYFMLYVSTVDINETLAYLNIRNFVIIIFLVLALMLIYTRHFVQNVSDVIHIMNRGLTEKDYNLQVKIHKEFVEHEIFKLAEYYNNVYLPEKLRKQQEEKEKKGTTLTMNDLLNFNK